MISFKEFNIADWFSVYRILAIPLLAAALLWGTQGLFTWLLLISYTTDAIDGQLARRLNLCSARGAQLDSIGDQLTLGAGLIGLGVYETRFVLDHLWPIGLALSLYLLQMVIAFIKYGKTTAFHTYLAKTSALAQGIFVLWALFFGPVTGLFWTVIVLGVIETAEEIALIYMYPGWVKDVKSIFWALTDPRRSQAGNPV
ncbi:CDP-alcohol phosphatidyltransferase family protein [Robiginitalea sp. M366]|uniref:CDP-alcohol phosphatidyltransferase family protein n=1 Tax=Robiginitalea aestuariiviva TaxID=3036903 RepID=UPI00240CFA5E|nr:CDP-alcohol phosphatidyltransferase family protein [Robiginitalea aestuariiviva]MDG1572010.1 CDP-alcohol phosphatidyltransferase family protein [Robiginitalea aestuariiviva]